MLRGTPLVIMLDIDGTLCDLVERADVAVLPEAVRAALVLLERRRGDGVHVALVTGRSVADAQRMIGITGIPIHGNHGMERLLEDGTTCGPDGFDVEEARLHAAAGDLIVLAREFPGTSVEDKRFSLSVHFRGMNDELVPEFLRRASQIAERNGLRSASGKRVVNVLPVISRNKGDAVRDILHETGATSSTASILFVGDDVTDEDAFVALRPIPGAVTARVGEPTTQSAARYSLDDTRAVRELLQTLVNPRT
jgi:alpha,alpha-trehalase